MNFDLKLGKTAAVLFLALAMAGCGGGGTTVMEPMEPDPPPPTAAEQAEQLETARKAVMDAQAAVDALPDDPTPQARFDADTALEEAKKALADAEALPENVRAQLAEDLKTTGDKLTALRDAINAVNMAVNDVDALTADSDSAMVTAAEEAVADAKEKVNALDMDDQMKFQTQIDSAEKLVMAVKYANAATMAAELLDGDSDQAAATMAEDAITMAQEKVDALDMEDQAAFQMQLDSATMLVMAAKYVDMARTAAVGLSGDFNAENAEMVAAAEKAVEDAQMKVDDLDTDDQMEFQTQLDMANDVVMAAELVMTATMLANGLDENSDQATVMAAREALTDAKMAVEDLDMDAQAQFSTQIASLEGEEGSIVQGETRLADELNMKVTGVANTLSDAFTEETTDVPDQTLGGMGATTPYELAISSDGMGPMIMITNPNRMDDPDTEEDEREFMLDMDLGSVGSGMTSLTKHVLEYTDDGSMKREVVYIATDYEVEMVPFSEFVAEDFTTLPQVLNADRNGDPAATTFEALRLDGVAFSSAEGIANIGITMADVTSSYPVEVTYSGDNPDTPDVDEAFETEGTYNGAAGTFRCEQGGCTISFTEDGAFELISGFVFIPDDGATSPQPDVDFLYYGAWLTSSVGSDGVTRSYDEVETFAGSRRETPSDVSDLMGRASYEGGAAGVYVSFKEYDTETGVAEPTKATAGHFTADASLIVNFGQTDTLRPDEIWKVTGTIDEFVLTKFDGTTDAPMGDPWSVSLVGGVVAAELGAEEGSDGRIAGSAKTGASADIDFGTFEGFFHETGDIDVSELEADDPFRLNYPSAGTLVGEFDAVFAHGKVAGGFGTKMQQPE